MTSPKLRTWLIAIVASVVSLSFLAVALIRDSSHEAWVVVVVGFAVNFVAALFAVSLRLSGLEREIEAGGKAGRLGDLKAFWSVPAARQELAVALRRPAYGLRSGHPHRLFDGIRLVADRGDPAPTLWAGVGRARELQGYEGLIVVSSPNLVMLGGVVSIPWDEPDLRSAGHPIPASRRRQQPALDHFPRAVHDVWSSTRRLPAPRSSRITPSCCAWSTPSRV